MGQFLNEEIVYDDEGDDTDEYDEEDDYDYTYEDDEGEFTDVEEKPPIPSSPTSDANGGRDLMTSETEDEVIGSFSDPEENAVIGQASHIEASSASNNGLNSLYLALISVVLCSYLLR